MLVYGNAQDEDSFGSRQHRPGSAVWCSRPTRVPVAAGSLEMGIRVNCKHIHWSILHADILVWDLAVPGEDEEIANLTGKSQREQEQGEASLVVPNITI